MTGTRGASGKRAKRTGTTATTAPAPAWAWPADWSNQHMAVATEEAQILLRGLEKIRMIQEQAMRDAAARHAAAMQTLQGSQPVAGVVALQVEVLRQDIEGSTQCMQQVAGTALEMAAELFACSTHLVNTEDAFEAARRLVPD